MADEGYLIGYEDVNGNFVQIGQFNNAADDVTQPLVLRHTNSGETLELDGSSFRPSTQIGDTNNRPDVFANTVDLNTLVGAGLDTKADLTQSGGVLVASQLPDLAITNIDVVADQNARLALNAEEGDVAIQTDISETFILSTNDPTVDSNWKKVQLDVLGAIDGQTITPAQTGTSTNPTDVEAGNIEAGTIGSSGSRPDLLSDTIDTNGFDLGSYSIEKLDSSTALNTTFTAPFNDNEVYVIRVKTANGGGGTDLTMTFNGVTGNYTYFDLSGTRRTTQKIRLVEFGGFAVTSGYVTISYGVTQSRAGFSSDLISGRWSNIDQMATKGGVTNATGALSSIELSADSILETELYRLAI